MNELRREQVTRGVLATRGRCTTTSRQSPLQEAQAASPTQEDQSKVAEPRERKLRKSKTFLEFELKCSFEKVYEEETRGTELNGAQPKQSDIL